VKPLPLEGQVALCVSAQKGDLKARDTLITTSMGLVYGRALYWVRMARSLTVEDMVGEGTFGLFDAIRRFDATKGASFPTYATFWINRSMRDALAADREIRRADDRRRKYARQVQELLDNDEPLEQAVEAVAALHDVNPSTVRGVYDSICRPRELSISTPIDESRELGDTLASPLKGPDEQLEREEQALFVRTVIARMRSRLSARNRMIFDMRILDDQLTLREVGTKLTLSFERVRQIEVELRAKLKARLSQKRAPRASFGHAPQAQAHPRQLPPPPRTPPGSLRRAHAP